MCCKAKKIWQYCTGLFGILSVIWITADQIFDCLVTANYYYRTVAILHNKTSWRHNNGHYPNPFTDRKFLSVDEGRFFVASAASIALPAAVATLVFVIYHLVEWSVRIKTYNKNQCCCHNESGCSTFAGVLCCSLALPFSFLGALVYALIVPICFVIFPVLQFIIALFRLFGIEPNTSERPNTHPIQGPNFQRFWTLVLLLKVCEQLIEAPLQIIINFVYLKFYDPSGCHDSMDLAKIWDREELSFFGKVGEAYKMNCVFHLYLSMTLSIGSFLMFITVQVYQLSLNYDQSIWGMGQDFYQQSTTMKRFKRGMGLTRANSTVLEVDAGNDESIPLQEIITEKRTEKVDKTDEETAAIELEKPE